VRILQGNTGAIERSSPLRTLPVRRLITTKIVTSLSRNAV
jgi:hypothetical protein